MTELREMFVAVLRDEPVASAIDPYAAVGTARRRRTTRRRWTAGLATVAVVAATVAYVGLPRFGAPQVGDAGPAGSVDVSAGWIGRPGLASDALDPTATRAALSAAGVDVPALLGLPAVAVIFPEPNAGPPSLGGELRLRYRTGGEHPNEVDVLLQGPQLLPWGAVQCPYKPPDPITAWPLATSSPVGDWWSNLLECRRGPRVATFTDGPSRMDRVVAAVGKTGGMGSVTVSAAAGLPAPVTVTRALATLAALTGYLVFVSGPDRTTASPSPSKTTASTAGSVTYAGAVTSTFRDAQFGLTSAPSKVAPVLTWQQAYQHCLSDGMCRTDMTVTIRFGLATSDYPASIHPDGTPFPSGPATPDILHHPAYVLMGHELAQNCPLPAGAVPGQRIGSPPPAASRGSCTTAVILDSTSGQLLTATQLG